MSTWTWIHPARLPSRAELQPQPPAHTATDTTPTVRQQYDGHVARLAAAVHAGDAHAARAFHAAAREVGGVTLRALTLR